VKFEVGDLITLSGLASLSTEEMYKLKLSKPPFPDYLEFIGVVIEVDVALTYYSWDEVGYKVHWLGDTGLGDGSVFFEHELELIERGKG
jgi:hypothetical protein